MEGMEWGLGKKEDRLRICPAASLRPTLANVKECIHCFIKQAAYLCLGAGFKDSSRPSQMMASAEPQTDGVVGRVSGCFSLEGSAARGLLVIRKEAPKGYQLHRTLALFALGLCIWPGLQILPAESPKLQRVDHGGLHLDPAHENPERGGGALIHGLLGLVHCI